jgi:kynureninase
MTPQDQGTSATTREYAEALDAADPLARFRERFVLADDVVYLDGNSLGRLPVSTAGRLRQAVEEEWGAGLIRSWADWVTVSRDVGDLIGTGILAARPGEVVISDSTTVNLYKLACAALDARPGRRVIVTDDDNFPTDLYVFQGLAAQRGLELRVVHTDLDAGLDPATLAASLDDEVALVSLSHVAYRSGALVDMAAVTRLVHDVGALVLWDLSHAAGSVPVPLAATGADLAVGCTYKYLNGGPGAPAFLYVRSDLQETLRAPIWGWFGQADQFGMASEYDPVKGIERFCAGTPPVLATYAVREGAQLVAEAGIPALHAKAIAMTSYLVDLADTVLVPFGFTVASPRDPNRRGAHVTLHHPHAWQICQALVAAGVVPDFRSPDRLRIGPAPLYTRFVDVWEGIERTRRIVTAGEHLGFPAERSRVT